MDWVIREIELKHSGNTQNESSIIWELFQFSLTAVNHVGLDVEMHSFTSLELVGRENHCLVRSCYPPIEVPFQFSHLASRFSNVNEKVKRFSWSGAHSK